MSRFEDYLLGLIKSLPWTADLGDTLYGTLHSDNPNAPAPDYRARHEVAYPGYRRIEIPTPPVLIAMVGDVCEERRHVVTFAPIDDDVVVTHFGIVELNGNCLFFQELPVSVRNDGVISVEVKFPARLL